MPDKSKRIFIAILLPVEIKKNFLVLINKWGKMNWPLKPATKDNLHLTLKFLDSKTEKEIELIKQRISAVLNHEKPFSLSLQGVEIFPTKRNPKVISVCLKVNKRLGQIERKISQSLSNFPLEKRIFHPHITLFRIKGKLNCQAMKQIEGIKLKGEWPVSGVALMESDLSGKTPIYKVIHHYSFLR